MTPFKKHLPGPHALKRSLRWYALCLGPTVGCALLTLVLMRIIDLEQSIRAAHPWLYLFLPFGVIATYAFQCPFPQKALPVALQDLHEPPNDNGPHHALSFIYGSTLLTHLFGGSAGREGAGFQAAAVIGQRFGGRYGHEGPPRRIVVSSATAAVFAVLFGTPIAAGVFAFELTRAGRFPANSLVPCFAGGLAGSIVTVVAGPPASQFKHLFSVLPPAAGGSPLPAEPCLFLIVLLLGILAGGLSCAFTELSLQVRYLCSWVIEPRWVAPLLASVALAALGFFTPARAYMGLGILPAGPHEPSLVTAFQGEGLPAWGWLIKLGLTLLTVAAGYRGGEIVPLLLTATLLVNSLCPVAGVTPPLLCSLAFISIFAAAANTPVAAIVLSSELFGSGHLAYYVLGALVAYSLSPPTRTPARPAIRGIPKLLHFSFLPSPIHQKEKK